tara:strand:- start:3830 stop:4123 length:294 start_codon:yes stop_codon:yes gene_type:complete
MEKGDIIKDIRDGSTHMIESVESFGVDTVIFTEGSKCIPVKSVKEYDEVDLLEETLRDNPEIIEAYIMETFLKPYTEYLEKLKDFNFEEYRLKNKIK